MIHAYLNDTHGMKHASIGSTIAISNHVTVFNKNMADNSFQVDTRGFQGIHFIGYVFTYYQLFQSVRDPP